jgi:hypothetical protein
MFTKHVIDFRERLMYKPNPPVGPIREGIQNESVKNKSDRHLVERLGGGR